MDINTIITFLFNRIQENFVLISTTIVLSIYLHYLIKSYLSGNHRPKSDKYAIRAIILAVLLILFSVIYIANYLLYYGSFKEPDPYTNIIDAKAITQYGHIGDVSTKRFTYLKNSYYSSFPLFIMLMSTLNIVLNADFYSIYFFSYMLFLSLFLISVIILLKILSSKELSILNYFFVFGSLSSSIYLYGALGTYVPSRLGLLILTLLITIFVKNSNNMKKNDILVALLLGVAAIVHGTITITFVLLILMLWALHVKRAKNKFGNKGQISLLVSMPFILYMLYSSYALGSFYEILSLLWHQFTLSVEYGTTVGQQVYRVTLFNQLTRGINISLSMAPAIIYSIKYLWKKNGNHLFDHGTLFLFAMTMIGTLYTLIAGLNYLLYGRPVYGSYFLVIASLLLGIVSTLVLLNISWSIGKTLHIYLLVVLMLISVIGVNVDPYVFKTDQTSWYVSVADQTKTQELSKFLSFSFQKANFLLSFSEVRGCTIGLNTYLSFVLYYYGIEGINMKTDCNLEEIYSHVTSLNLIYSNKLFSISYYDF